MSKHDLFLILPKPQGQLSDLHKTDDVKHKTFQVTTLGNVMFKQPVSVFQKCAHHSCALKHNIVTEVAGNRQFESIRWM